MVINRSKMHATLQHNYPLMPGDAWLKLLLRQVPDKGEHLVRCCGWYSNRARGMRCLVAEQEDSLSGEPEIEEAHADLDPEFRDRVKSNWARLIRKVSAIAPALLYLRYAGPLHPCSRTRSTR